MIGKDCAQHGMSYSDMTASVRGEEHSSIKWLELLTKVNKLEKLIRCQEIMELNTCVL